MEVIREHSGLLARLNRHVHDYITCININKSFFHVVTVEANRDDIWTKVLRTVHLHGNKPIVSLDYVETSCPPVDATNPIPEDMKKCKNKKCRRFGDKIMTCGGCNRARYCSRSCQKYDWKHGHKEECTTLGCQFGQRGLGNL